MALSVWACSSFASASEKAPCVESAAAICAAMRAWEFGREATLARLLASSQGSGMDSLGSTLMSRIAQVSDRVRRPWCTLMAQTTNIRRKSASAGP